MLPALQPSRPKFPPASQARPPPLRQQPTRQTSTHAPGEPSQATAAFSPTTAPSHNQGINKIPPRSQIEAMPPFSSAGLPPPPHPPHPTFATPLSSPGIVFPPIPQPRLLHTPITQHYDSAIRHPVFFSSALRKPPFPLPPAANGGVNPVAHGYVVEDGGGGGGGGGGARRKGAVRGKL